jgi:hypothetical protein
MSAETLHKSGIERMSTKRFRFAFSFAGEKRDFVIPRFSPPFELVNRKRKPEVL